MPRNTYGDTVKKRVKRLLEALLAFVNWEFEGNFDIEFKWEAEDSTNPKLIVKTTLVTLEWLIEKDKYPDKLTKTQIREALKLLKDFLKILEDNRTQTKGVDTWHFTLTLWSKDREKNLKQFDKAWEDSRPEKSKALEANFKKSEAFDWRNIGLAMLEAEKRLTTNELMRYEEDRFELEEIHVPLALVERKKPNLIGGETQAEQGSRLYEPEYEEKQRFEHEQFLLDILKDGKGKHNGKRIAIIGEPGAGKTTLLRKIAFWVHKENTEILPISISLADLPETNSKQEFLEQYLLDKWLKAALPYISLEMVEVTEALKTELKKLCNQGRLWLLLDGVDEMPVQGEERLWAISNQLKGWVGQARVVLTCRLNVWEANRNVLADNFEIYRTLDFSYGDSTTPDRVEEFIAKWFNKTPNLGQQLRQELDKPGKERIKDLVKNPLRLALLCSTWNWWRDRGGLPDTKAKLYQGFVEKFYDWKGKEPTNYTQREKLNRALGELAKLAIDQTTSRFRLKHSLVCEVLGKPDEGLFELALQLGWLNEVGLAAESPDEKVYAFWHPTFEEYFAACEIKDWHFFLNHVPQNPKLGIYRIFEQQWKEVMLLWIGRKDVDREEKEEFIKALVEFKDGIEHEFYGYRACFLAVVLIGEFKECYFADEIIGGVVILGFSCCQIERQHYLRLIDPFPEAARAVLLETDRTIAIAFLVNLICIGNESTRWQAAFILGQIDRGNEEAIDELIRALEFTKDEYTRKIIAESLEQISLGDEAAISKLIRILASTEDENTRDSVANILSKTALHNEFAISNLIKVLESTEDEHTRWKVAGILGDIAIDEQWVIDRLIQVLVSAERQSIRSVARFILSIIAVSHERAIRELIIIIKLNENTDIRCSAIAILGGIAINHEVAISTLLTVLESAKDGRLYSIAASTLGQIAIGNARAIVALTKVLESTDEDKYTRSSAVISLGQIAIENEQVIAALTRVLESIKEEDEDTRMTVAESLGQINLGNELAITEFIRIIKSNKYEYLRYRAIYRLGQTAIGNKQAIITLIQVLEFTEDENTRRNTTDSLGKIALDDEYAITELIRVMESNENESTRRSVADILRKIVTQQQWVFTHLIRVIESTKYEDNGWNVAEILGKIAIDNKQVISEIIRIMKFNKNESIIKISAFCLGQIATGNNKAITALIKVMKATKYEIIISIVASSLDKIAIGDKRAIAELIGIIEFNHNESTRNFAAITLGKIAKHNKPAIAELIRILESTKNESICRSAGESLYWILENTQQMQKVITAFKHYLFEQNYKSNLYQLHGFYKFFWRSAQNLPYPDFYQAWHQDTLTNTATASLNLANLPQILAEAINNQPDLCSKIKLICIDSHQFIESENPAPEIYDEMLNQNCPEWQNGYPDTMQKLKIYWNSLRRQSEIPLFFICYDSTALSATPTGFNDSFLKALSKFDRAICVVCEQGDIPLPTFSPSQPDLVAAVVAWIRRSLLENRDSI